MTQQQYIQVDDSLYRTWLASFQARTRPYQFAVFSRVSQEYIPGGEA